MQTSEVRQRNDEVPIIAAGTTSHGLDWYVLAIDRRWQLHMQYGDLDVDAGVPVGTPLATLRLLAEAIY